MFKGHSPNICFLKQSDRGNLVEKYGIEVVERDLFRIFPNMWRALWAISNAHPFEHSTLLLVAANLWLPAHASIPRAYASRTQHYGLHRIISSSTMEDESAMLTGH